MAIKNNTWAGGAIGSTVASDLGAAGGDAFDSASTAFPKYATVNGETVAQIDGITLGAANAILRRVILTPKLKLRQVFTLSALPANPLFLERVAHGTTAGAEAGSGFDVEVKASGRLGLTIAGGVDVWLSPSATPLATNTEYRLEVYAEAGTSTTTGAIRVTLFQGRTSSTILYDSTLLTGVNVASTSGNFTTMRRGKYDGAAYAGVYNILPGMRSATDSDASNAVDPVTVPAATGDAYPTGTATGGFTRSGSAATDAAALADTDDTTYVESGTLTSTIQTFRIPVQAMTTRTSVAVPLRLRMGGSGTCSAIVRLMQGSTSRGSLGPISITSSWTDYVLNLNASQAAAITDWSTLAVEIDATS